LLTDQQALGAILAFMGARCRVSSHHKLPDRQEILSTVVADFVGRDRISHLLDRMLSTGVLVAYGPYISDHEIDTL
jgi:hypothetical protein